MWRTGLSATFKNQNQTVLVLCHNRVHWRKLFSRFCVTERKLAEHWKYWIHWKPVRVNLNFKSKLNGRKQKCVETWSCSVVWRRAACRGGKAAARTHVCSIIVRISVYENGQTVEVSIVGKHGPCRENKAVKRSHTLTSIPWRSLRNVSKKIARPKNWSWLPNTGPRMEAEMRRDVSRHVGRLLQSWGKQTRKPQRLNMDGLQRTEPRKPTEERQKSTFLRPELRNSKPLLSITAKSVTDSNWCP